MYVVTCAAILRDSCTSVWWPAQDDRSLETWRCQHSSVRELRIERGKDVQRRECAVGSLLDDYDCRERGIPRVTYSGRMRTESHHAKTGNMKNACSTKMLTARIC